ncbi:MAG: glyoxalase/bleomycin resistance/dioxygenase family protein [Pseudomonadota bacterium]
MNCVSISTSEAWFSELFGREPDAKPMAGLCEWCHGDSAGLQLFENGKDAGHGALTMIVRDLHAERVRLEAAGLAPGPIEPATTTSLVRLTDPDRNLIVLAQPR